MLRMRVMVVGGVMLYTVVLFSLHRTFMAIHGERQHDALVHAILHDQSRFLRLKPLVLRSQRPDLRSTLPSRQTTVPEWPTRVNMSQALAATLNQDWAYHPVLLNWKHLMEPVISKTVLDSQKDNDTVFSLVERFSRHIQYPPFNISLPNFITDFEVKWFLKNQENANEVGVRNPQKRRGEVSVLHNVTVHYFIDCGYKTHDEDFPRVNPALKSASQRLDGLVIPLLVPDSHAFQHFLDGLLPKLMQVLDIALLPGVQLLIMYPRDEIIFEMLDTLGISRDKLIFYKNEEVYLTTMINTCVTPPLHPTLWRTSRALLGAPEKRTVSVSKSLVILLTRVGSLNVGRNMLNSDDVKYMLENRYKERLHIFEGGLNLQKTIDLFSRAAIVIGVHGGAFYNINFAPRNTHIIEFTPFSSNALPLPNLAHQIFWFQANLLEQQYWRLQLIPRGLFGDVLVPLNNLTAILNRVDDTLKLKPA